MRENQAQRDVEKELLNITELCEYLGIGQKKARELLHDPANGFTVRIGNSRTRTRESSILGGESDHAAESSFS